MKAFLRLLLLVLLIPLAPPAEAADPVPIPGFAGVAIFEMPGLAEQLTRVLARARAGDLVGAADALDRLIADHPQAWTLHTTRAAIALAAGDRERAITALLEADRLGAPGLASALTRAPLDALADDARLAGLSDHPPPAPAPLPEPALIKGGQALVTPDNTGWDPKTARLITRFAFPPILKTHAFLDRPPPGPLTELNQLVARPALPPAIPAISTTTATTGIPPSPRASASSWPMWSTGQGRAPRACITG